MILRPLAAIFLLSTTTINLTHCHDCTISIRRSSANCTFNLLAYESFGILQRKSTNPRRLGIWARFSAAPSPLGPDSEIYHPGTIHELDKSSKLLVPIPLLISCENGHQSTAFAQSCEFVFGRLGSSAVTSSIPIKNFTILNQQSSALFLEQGSTFLRRCSVVDCPIEFQMNPNQQLTLNIMLPKQVGTQCLDVDDCGPADLYECRHESCECRSDSEVASVVLDQHGRICSSVNDSDVVRCHNDPTQCRSRWCDGLDQIDCLCPYSSNKVRRADGKFICELEEGSSCQRHKSRSLNRILKCPPQTHCVQNECRRGLDRRSSDGKSGEKDSSVIIKTFVVVLIVVLVFVFAAMAIAMCKLSRKNVYRANNNNNDQDSVISKVFSPLDERISTHSSDFSRFQNRNFHFSTLDRRLLQHQPNNNNNQGWFTPQQPPPKSTAVEFNDDQRRRHHPCPPWCMAANNAVIAQLEKTFKRNDLRNFDEGYATDPVVSQQEQTTNQETSPSCPIVQRLSNGDVTISA